MNRYFLWPFLFGMLISGCASQPKSGLDIKGAPEWVNRGGGWATLTGGGRVFAGVGMISNIRDRSLATEAADNRARAEIAKIFSVFLQTVFSDFQNSTEQIEVARSISTASEASLAGVIIKEHWLDPKTDTLYSLAELDLKWVVENIGGTHIDEGLKNFVRKNAQEHFDNANR